MAAVEEIGADAARRMALAAQGLARPRPDAPGARQLRDAARRLGVVQIDSVNVVSRTHYLPPFSRLGAYPREALESEAWGRKPSLFEYWGHEASLMPVETQPLLRWRMARARDGQMWTGLARFGRERADHIELVRISARALGVATEPDLRDYFRLPVDLARQAVRELVEAGELTPVKVRGWRQAAYLWPEARRPRRVEATALLSPFDNLIWTRDRTERLFGVRVRLEIYTPAEKRSHGYYVLPFLEGETITARVDLKADRKAGVLRVQAAWREDATGPETAARLAEELRRMAGWLGLERVETTGRGDLARDLSAAL